MSEIEKSVAVMPCDDQSPDGDQGPLAQGLAEGIINALAQLPDLKVIGINSVIALLEENADIETIAERLAVATVLECSLQQADDVIRIRPRLVEAATGVVLWAEDIDRPATNVFAIQDQVARAVADRLQVVLGGGEDTPLVAAATEDLDAYNLYLRGRAAYRQRRAVEDVDAALAFYQRAVDVDPTYAQAYAGLAEAWSVRPSYAGEGLAEDLARAEVAARTAISLDRTLAQGHLALANIQRDRWQWEAAEASYRLALVGGEDPEAHHEYGEFLLDIGRAQESVAAQQRAISRDPLSALFHGWLAFGLLGEGRLEEALDAARGGIAIDGQSPQPRMAATYALIELGRLEEALEEARAVDGLGGPFLPTVPVVSALLDATRRREAVRILSETGLGGLPSALVYSYALLGDVARALSGFEEWIDTQPYGTTAFLWWPSTRRLLGDDPRYQALLERVGITR